jgi:glycosyltransferase involved in cell wall biosynthesis
MMIYNTAELNTGIGVYAYNLSNGLNVKLNNEFLSHSHYYIDYFMRSLWSRKVDDIIINSSVFSNYYLGKKNIFIIHDFFYKDYSKYMPKFSKFLFDYALFLAKFSADKFICVSNYTYKRALKELKDYKYRLEVIYPFVDMRFNYQGEKKKDRIILLMDASNFKNKNPKYYQDFYKYVFLNKYEFYSRVNKLGYPLKPIVLDFKTRNYKNIPFEDVIDIYKNSNVFLSFSENEGFGYPLSQAILSGNSVVAYPNETYKELLGSDFRYYIKNINDFKEIHEIILQSLDDVEMRKSIYNRISTLINPISLKKEWERVFDKLGIVQ